MSCLTVVTISVIVTVCWFLYQLILFVDYLVIYSSVCMIRPYISVIISSTWNLTWYILQSWPVKLYLVVPFSYSCSGSHQHCYSPYECMTFLPLCNWLHYFICQVAVQEFFLCHLSDSERIGFIRIFWFVVAKGCDVPSSSKEWNWMLLFNITLVTL